VFLIKVVLIRNFTLLLKALGKECSLKWGPDGKKHPFPEPYLAHLLGSPPSRFAS
jgi:hypothetical protein